jgi:Na+-translocating ferredoxin:NAD+ oxidoreductase RnfD subunit
VTKRLTPRRFFRTPKGLLILILAALVAIAAPHEGIAIVAPPLLSAVLLAGSIDALILRYRHKHWEFPDGAVLTALLVAMVLSAQGPWYYAPLTAAAGVISKYIFRSRAANVFNPAALGIVATFYIFNTGQSWWGALPEVHPAAQLVLLATGWFIVDRVNKMPLVLAFLGSYFLLFTVAAFVGNPVPVAEIFRTPDLQAALFFAVFILSDPPTSPVKYHDQLIFGVLVAVVSFAVFQWIGAVYYLLAGVLAGNAWEAWRRVHRRSVRGFPHGIPLFLREISPWRLRARPIAHR